MKNDILDEYLDRVRDEQRGLPNDQRDAMLREMRAHLEEAIEQRRRAEPTLTLEAATLKETRAFGEPAEMAINQSAPATARPLASAIPRWAIVMITALVGTGFVVGLAMAIFAAVKST